MVNAVVLIRTARGQANEVAATLAGLDQFPEVFSVAGRYDLVAIMRVRSFDEVAGVVNQSLARIDGIVDTETMVALRAYSRDDVEAVFSLGGES